jgi:hypothetical protein
LHLQVHLLQAKEDLALLQHPVEVDGMFRPRTKGAHPGMVVLMGRLILDVLGIAFHAHHPKGALETCQSIIPCGDDAFSIV